MKKDSEIFLEIRDLEVVYTSGRKTVHAVNKVSLQMKKGETLALVGETGAGKTTIAKAVMRILPDPPARLLGGKILLDGDNLLEKRESEMLKVRGEKASMIFQDPMTALNPLMSVGGQIAEVLLLHNNYGKEEAQRNAKQMLEMVGIPAERYAEYPFEFSGGMKQRVIIAMALACEPEFLLADEPTTALDVTIQAQVMDLIGDLKKKYHTSMMLITHDLGVVAQTCDHVAVLYAGEIVEYGSREEVFLQPSHPYTVGLFSSLPAMNREARRLTPIAGTMPDPTDLPSGCAFHPRCPYAEERCKKGSVALSAVSGEHVCRCIRLEKEG